MATGNTADGIGHGDNGETEGECRSYYARRGSATDKYGGSAADQCQDQGSDKFCKILSHILNDLKGFIVRGKFSKI